MNTAETPNTGNNDPSQSNSSGEHADSYLKQALGAAYETLGDEDKAKLIDRAAKNERVRNTLGSMGKAKLGEMLENADEATVSHYSDIIMSMLNDAVEPASSAQPTPGTEIAVPQQGEVAPVADTGAMEQTRATWRQRVMGKALYAYSRPFIWMGKINKGYRDRYNAATPEQKKKMEKRASVIGTIGAVAVGTALYFAKSTHLMGMFGNNSGSHDQFPDADGFGGDHRHPLGAESFPTSIDDIKNFFESAFDPANYPDKQHPHDFSHPMPDIDPQNMDLGVDAIKEQLRGNTSELVDYASRMHVDGFKSPDQFASLQEYDNYVAEKTAELNADPSAHMNAFRDVADKLDNHLTSVDKQNITDPYSSGFIQNGRYGTDGYVNFGGTYTEMTFDDGTVINRRDQCGQCIEFIETPEQSAPGTSSHAAPSQPQGGSQSHYTPETPQDTPQSPTETSTPPTDTTTPPGGETTPPGGGGETPQEGKDYSGGVDTADGIDPSKNGFQGWTPDPAESGNGTASDNLTPGAMPGSESAHHANGAAPNTDPQVGQQENGAGTSRTDSDAAARQHDAAAADEQRAANQRAQDADNAMRDSRAADRAARREQAGMGADGRPRR